MMPTNRLPGPNLSRTNSVDQSGNRVPLDQSGSRFPIDQSGNRTSQTEQIGIRVSADQYGEYIR